MFERLTELGRWTIAAATEEARKAGRPISSEHLLLGIVQRGGETTKKILLGQRVTVERVRTCMSSIPVKESKAAVQVEPAWSEEAMRVLESAADETRTLGHSWIGTEHLLLGLIREAGCHAAEILKTLGTESLRSAILTEIKTRGSGDEPPMTPQ